MNELRLLFARAENGGLTYRIAASGGDAGAPQPFAPFLSEKDYEDLRWYLEDFMMLPIGGSLVRARGIEEKLTAWGRELFAKVFGDGDHRELYNDLLDGGAPRLLTIGSKDLEVLRLPWELMADGKGPVSRRGVTIRRQLETAGRKQGYDAGKLPLRILLAVSRPDDTGFLDPRHTTRAMLEALGALGDGVVVDFCRPATLARLDRMLTEADRAKKPYHLVHFDGHGTFLPKSQIGALCFEKDEGEDGKVGVDMVRADTIGALLSAHKIPLAILEACRSGQVGNVAALSGVAPALIEAGVGSVLSMSHAVHVEATKILLERFYEDVVAGATIGEALEQGRAALMAKPDRWLERGPGGESVALKDWFLPHLYQRGEDLVLAPVGAKKPKGKKVEVRRKPAENGEVGAFPDKPMYGFFGRAAELHTIERRFLKHRAVLLHAMGGMGKTSLAREAAYWWTAPTGLFPDGACFVSFEQPGGAQRAVQVVGAYFEGAEFEQRSTEEQKKRARELVQTKRVLVVWDNFESVLPAFQGGEGVELYGDEERQEVYRLFREWTGDDKGAGRVLVTCRPGETGLGAVCKMELAGLARPNALSLLYRVMLQEGIAGKYERDELIALLKALENHPLSVELVGPHLKHKDMTPRKIVEDFKVLLDKFKGDAEVERNRSLLASLGFSLNRLSKEAREAVRWLGMFRGGVFEQVLLWVSQIEPGVWDKTRGELEATALVKVERDVMFGDKPYLRFHPTLAYAAADGVADPEVRQRYVPVYLAVRDAAYNALMGSNPRGGMDVMLREEANFRTAVAWALAEGAYDPASYMGDTLGIYLQLSGRLRERDRWAAWLADEVRRGGFSAAVAARERDAAMALLSQGKPKESIDKLEALVERLKHTSEFDAAFVLADASQHLGRIYYVVGWSQKAIPVLEDAVKQWEAVVEKARAAGESTEAERGNLAITIGDLANALMSAGELDRAMEAAARSNAIDREQGKDRNLAAGLTRTAQIFMMQGRFAEADARYEEALHAARRAGDRELQGTALQHQGILAAERHQYDRATQLYQSALQLFQDMHDDGAVMRTCNLLGEVDRKVGRLPEARAWYERSRELAERREDDESKGIAAQNLGIVCQQEGEAARAKGDEARARERFTEAARFVSESLAVWVASEDEPHQADSHVGLAQIHLLLGDLDKAEAQAHLAREIHERLGLKEAWKDYHLLAAIAQARNNPTQAAAWQQKRDTLLAELRRRAGPPAITQDLIQAIAQLALACAQAALNHQPIDADIEENLAALAKAPPPLDTLPPYCRALAAGALPPIPAALPKDLTTILTQVHQAIEQARNAQ